MVEISEAREEDHDISDHADEELDGMGASDSDSDSENIEDFWDGEDEFEELGYAPL